MMSSDVLDLVTMVKTRAELMGLFNLMKDGERNKKRTL